MPSAPAMAVATAMITLIIVLHRGERCSACMSLMFPTIYGIALKGMGDDAKFGAAGLIMAILGGSILPPLQASIIDMKEIASMPAVNVSFILPFICFLVIIGYGYRTVKRNW